MKNPSNEGGVPINVRFEYINAEEEQVLSEKYTVYLSVENNKFEDIEETEIDEDGNESQVINTYFVADLTNKEQSILAMVLVYEWFKRDVNDARQYRQKLSTRDFKTESSYQSLQKRSEYLDKMKEQIVQEIQNYQVDNMDSLYEQYGGL